MRPATVANKAVRVKKIMAFMLSRSRKEWKAFIKTIPRLLSIACAQDQASDRAVLWLITAPSVKKLAVLVTMPAASNNSLVFATKVKTNLMVSSYQWSDANARKT